MSFFAYHYIKFVRRLESFGSAQLDELAGRMGVLDRLDKRNRYFFAKSRYSAFSFPGGIAFGKAYWSNLADGQRMAIAAHEFSHIKNDDMRKRQARILLPGLVIVAAFALFWVYYLLPFMVNSIGLAMLGLISLVVLLSASLLLVGIFSAPWRRRTELRCDMEAARYVDGEDLISALELWEGEVSRKGRRKMRYRIQSGFYPPLTERVEVIRRCPQPRPS